MSESARGEGGRVWVPRKPNDTRAPKQIPASERYFFLEERFPKYGNLVPRDIATREIFNICVNEGLSVDPTRMCVYLDLTHIPRHELDRKLGGILEIYEKFQGVDPREEPMKIFPAVHYSMGGLWVDYEANGEGGLLPGSPRNQSTNIPGLYAIGECDYQYHGANRLGANSLLSCIFSGLFVGPGIVNWMKSNKAAADLPKSIFERAVGEHTARHKKLLSNASGAGENPYLLHQELGDIMTRTATVVRYNNQLTEAYEKVSAMIERSQRCSLADTGNWTNQNVIFTKSLQDMIPIAQCILKGALMRDESRGAHFKPDFCMPSLQATDPTERRLEAEKWCDAFEGNTNKFLKSSVCSWKGQEPDLVFEDIDTRLMKPRPRLYGLVGGEVIEEVWKQRSRSKEESAPSKPAAAKQLAGSV
jgi:succinate dehydrogenase / fumarate reductase flavoprotein subunit